MFMTSLNIPPDARCRLLVANDIMGGVVVNNSYGGDTPNTLANDDRYWADRWGGKKVFKFRGLIQCSPNG
jgi:hypothetical protein